METTFFKGLVKASIFGTLLLPTVLQAQQDTISINPQLTQKIMEENRIEVVDVFPVEYKEIEIKKNDTLTIKRFSYMVTGVSINSDRLSGEYIKLPNQYSVALIDIRNKYLKDELIVENNYDARIMTREYDLIQKIGTNEYYYIMTDNFIDKCIQWQAQEQILKIVHRLGYKEYKDGEDFYIKSKTAEIRLDARTHSELKKNPNYIATLDADQAKISALVKQTASHSKTLNQYLSQYRIQKSKLPAATIKAWRTATTKAQNLLDQINKLSEKYDGNYSFTLLNKSNSLEYFLDNLLASKGVLGM